VWIEKITVQGTAFERRYQAEVIINAWSRVRAVRAMDNPRSNIITSLLNISSFYRGFLLFTREAARGGESKTLGEGAALTNLK